MNDQISTKIQQLPDLRKSELSILWQELFVQPPHPKLCRELMIPILAYHLQENPYGGLTVMQIIAGCAECLKSTTDYSLHAVVSSLDGSKSATLHP